MTYHIDVRIYPRCVINLSPFIQQIEASISSPNLHHQDDDSYSTSNCDTKSCHSGFSGTHFGVWFQNIGCSPSFLANPNLPPKLSFKDTLTKLTTKKDTTKLVISQETRYEILLWPGHVFSSHPLIKNSFMYQSHNVSHIRRQQNMESQIQNDNSVKAGALKSYYMSK